MKELRYIIKIILKHYGYLIAGIILMLFFAVFSGISITMAVPFFDYVFPEVEVETYYHRWPEFYEAMREVTANFGEEVGFARLLNIENIRPLLSEYGEIMERTAPMLLLRIVAAAVLILILLKNTFYFLHRVMFANLNGKTIQDIRDNIFTNYMSQSLKFFSAYPIGDSLVRLVNDVEVISKLFITSMFNACRNIVLILVYVRIALFLNARLFLISLVVLPITTYIVTFIGKKIKKYAHRIQAKYSDIFSRVEEVLTNIKIVKAYGKEKKEIKDVKKLNRRFFLFWRKSEIYRSMGVPISEINGTVMGIIILLVGGRDVISGAAGFSFGEFGAFLLAVFSMLHPVKVITKSYNDLKKAKVSIDRIMEVISREPDLTEDEHPVSKKSFEDKIVFDNVCFSYGGIESQRAESGEQRAKSRERKAESRELISQPSALSPSLTTHNSQLKTEVLRNITFTINKGEKTALVGSSGSGKTTIANLLLRLYDTTGGQITIDGIPIQKIKISDLRELLGVVTQESLLFSDTIANNIRFGSSRSVSDKDIENACRTAYAEEFIEQLPGKYDYYLHSKGGNLSGGQKQRLCIARAIVADPPVLILDEATSSLDTEAEQKVQKALEQATKQRTVIIIAHRLSTVISADKIIVLDKGEITGIGKHEELLNKCEKYRTLYDLK